MGDNSGSLLLEDTMIDHRKSKDPSKIALLERDFLRKILERD